MNNSFRHVQRTLQENKIKPIDEDIGSFLQRLLNCSQIIANDILTRVPSIAECKATKLERMISFLISKGFTPQDIIATPHILRQSGKMNYNETIIMTLLSLAFF